jgi:CheY-like chemotaxis protein
MAAGRQPQVQRLETILVVDDRPDNRLVLRHLLACRGSRILEAEDGRRAFELAMSDTPDLILMDNAMPVLDGLEATRLMRREPALRDTPIIIVSADTGGDAHSLALAAGATASLHKPVVMAQLLALVETLLEGPSKRR